MWLIALVAIEYFPARAVYHKTQRTQARRFDGIPLIMHGIPLRLSRPPTANRITTENSGICYSLLIVIENALHYIGARMTVKESSKEPSENVHPFVIPESQIRDYVENLGIHDVGTVATRFQIIADLTKRAGGQLAPADLRRIKQVAVEDRNKHYRRIMEAIIAGIEQGSQGINAAHLTASVAVQMIFRWSPEYFSALNGYRDELRKRKPVGLRVVEAK